MNSRDSTFDFLRTCALLHDIGKPVCWADAKPAVQHVEYTYQLLKSYIGEKYALSAMRHHFRDSYPLESHPKNDLEKIICLSNLLSSNVGQKEETVVAYPLPVTLTHVLSNGVILEKLNAENLRNSVRDVFSFLKVSKAVFESQSRFSYLELYKGLNNSGLKKIPADAINKENDVSLWIHLKMTSAFASCIYLDRGYIGENLGDYEFALICGDADQISVFVNQSLRLPDLNARSEKIKQATKKAADCVVDLLGPECLLFAGGGGLLALSPVKLAEKLCQEIKKSFETETRGLVTITTNFLKCNGEEIQKNFGALWKQAQVEMHWKKSHRNTSFFSAVDEDVEVCDVCHLNPSIHDDSGKTLNYDTNRRPERLCDSCWQLRTQGHGVSLNELKCASNWLGLIKADGDGIGRILSGETLLKYEKKATPTRLSSISMLIHDVCEKNLVKIVEKNQGRCIVAGGDDLLAFLPGEVALRVAVEISSEFKRAMSGVATMSAGVVFFPYNLPIYSVLEVASIMLKEAKENKDKDSVAFCFIGGVGVTPNEAHDIMHGPRKWNQLEEILRLADFMAQANFAAAQIRKIASISLRNSVLAEASIKQLMGRSDTGKGLSWSQGQKLLSNLESGIIFDAFTIYNLFKKIGELKNE